jgi:hypothetical protein
MRSGMKAISIVMVTTGPLLTSGPASAQQSSQKWKMLEADNGAVFGIDLNSIEHWNAGQAMAITCVAENNPCPPANMARLMFDCRGHYWDVDRGGDLVLAPPRSVVGRMAEIACAGAKDTRFTSTQPSPSPSPQTTVPTTLGKVFRDCLVAESKSGSYTTAGPAFDAAKSVTTLLGQCKAQWDVWQNECLAKGGPSGDLGGCAGRAYRTAYEILQTLGK